MFKLYRKKEYEKTIEREKSEKGKEEAKETKESKD